MWDEDKNQQSEGDSEKAFLKGLFSKEALAPSSQFIERLGNRFFFPFCCRIFITDTWLGVPPISLPVPDVTTSVFHWGFAHSVVGFL